MDSTSVSFRSHTALLLAAALPYLQPAYRHPVELAMKFLEFSETMKLYREFHMTDPGFRRPLHKKDPAPSGSFGIMELISRFVADPEGLLTTLSGVCTGREQEIVGMLQGLLRAKSFYETYGDILNGFMSTTGFTDAAESNSQPAKEEEFSMPDMASVLAGGGLTSMLNEEQTDTLNLLKSLLDAE